MFTIYLLLLLFLLTVPLLMRGRMRALASGEVRGLLGPGTTVDGLDLRLLKAQPERLQPLRGFVTYVGIRPVQVRDETARVPGGYLPPPGREPTYTIHCVFVRDRDGRVVELHNDMDVTRAYSEGQWLASALGVPLQAEPAVPPSLGAGMAPPPMAGHVPGQAAWAPPAAGFGMPAAGGGHPPGVGPAPGSVPYGADTWQPSAEEKPSWVNDWVDPAPTAPPTQAETLSEPSPEDPAPPNPERDPSIPPHGGT